MSVVVRSFRSGGWEVDIRPTLANGKRFRLRKKAPVASKSAAQKWGEATERDIIAKLGHLAPGDLTTSVRKEAPKLQDFAPRFIDGYAVATRLKPSGIAASKSWCCSVVTLACDGVRSLPCVGKTPTSNVA